MGIKQSIILIILLNFLCATSLMGQNGEKEYLKGLTKAGEEELLYKEIMLDGEIFPVYDNKGERIRYKKLMGAIMSENYVPDFYIDKNKEIKAAVLRTATEEEKKMMREMEAQMNGKSELIGKDAIPFSAKDIKGNEYALENLKGKIIVMNFWFVECKPCVIEMPDLNELVAKYKNEAVVFLGFARNDKSKIDAFLKKSNFSYNIIPDSKKHIEDYKIYGFPAHIIIDQNSEIVFSTSGLGHTTIKDIEKTIEGLLKK